MTPLPKRVLLKLSGEVLRGTLPYGYDRDAISSIVDDIQSAHQQGVGLALVIGGGNLFRSDAEMFQAIALERVTGDYIGMLATVMNALTLQAAIEQRGLGCRVLSGLPVITVCETYTRRKALHHLNKGRIVIFAGGTGNPLFSTDTAAVLRAIETDCEVIFKGTKVDGVFAEDPQTNPGAERFSVLHYRDVITRRLSVMDTTAIVKAEEATIPIRVFSIKQKGGFVRALTQNPETGTLITDAR